MSDNPAKRGGDGTEISFSGCQVGLTERELCPTAKIRSVPASAPSERPPWFALIVKPQHERAVERGLSYRRFEVYVPTYTATSRWSDRLKRVERPVLPGYVFCRFYHRERMPVLQTPGVRSMVSFGDQNPSIPDWEIARLQQTLASGLLVEPWPFLKAGQRVRIIAGPLAGIEAILLQLGNGWRVVVGIELLQRSISVQIDRDCIEPESASAWKSGVPSFP